MKLALPLAIVANLLSWQFFWNQSLTLSLFIELHTPTDDHASTNWADMFQRGTPQLRSTSDQSLFSTSSMNLSNPQQSHGMSWTCDTTVSPMTRWIGSPILALQQQIVELRISIPSSKDVDEAILTPKLEPNGRPKTPSHHLSFYSPLFSYIQSMGNKQNIPKSVQEKKDGLLFWGETREILERPPTPTTNHLNSSEKMTQTYSRMPPTCIKIWVWVLGHH